MREGTGHCGHDGEEQCQDHQDNEQLRDDPTGADQAAERLGDAGAVDDAWRQHAGMTKNALKSEGHEEEEDAAGQSRIEYRLEGIRLWIL